MLGHKLAQRLIERHETVVTVRNATSRLKHILPEAQIISGVCATDVESLRRAFMEARPDIVVNCIGMVKQKQGSFDAMAAIELNALLPHRLMKLCELNRARLITISTDCVFSGRRGAYSESDRPDPVDSYGMTKLLGEVDHTSCLTIRTSMIGRELGHPHGLAEWLLNEQSRSVKGYVNARFSGLTTIALSEVIEALMTDHPSFSGIWHIASEPISKFDLLLRLKEAYKLDVQIEQEHDFVCDRTLNGELFHQRTGIRVPSWLDMISRMVEDPTPYRELTNQHVN
jgi:dTDP-4-dehydrorhamnose reductase